MLLTKRCQFNGKIYQMDLPMTRSEFVTASRAWENGTLVQDAFPLLSAGEREFVMTGTTPKVWDEMFGRGLFSSKPPRDLRAQGSNFQSATVADIRASAVCARTGAI
jgi:hypothetical protein